MSGLEGLGATASAAQLVELCVKCGQTTARIIRSYHDAPKEIKEVAIKVETLKFRIEQVQGIADDLSGTELDDLLPEIHRDILLEQLQAHHQALLVIAGLSTGVGRQNKGARLQWALVDKRKTSRIMRDLAEVHETLDQILGIVSFCAPRADISRNSLAHYILGLKLYKTLLVVGYESCSKQPDRDYVDDLLMVWDREPNQTLHDSSWTFGATAPDNSKENTPGSTVPCYSGRLSVKFTTYYRDFRASLRVKFFLLNERIFNFELGLRQFTRAWTSISLSDCQIRVVNIRPADSPIFKLCAELDFDGIKTMLQNRLLLSRAIAAKSIPNIIFSKEIWPTVIESAGKADNFDSYFDEDMACGYRVDITTVVYEHCCKRNWPGPHEYGYIGSAIRHGMDITHWFLFTDKICEMARSPAQSPAFYGYDGESFWILYWQEYSTEKKHSRKWDFESVVTGARHLLLHGADPSDITVVGRRSPKSSYITGHGACKEWGLPQVEKSISPGSEGLHERTPYEVWAQPREQIRWSKDGLVWKTKYGDTSFRNGSIGELRGFRTGSTDIQRPGHNDVDGSDVNVNESGAVDALEDKQDAMNQSLFESIISTEEGRRQMQRVPMIKAYCCALQLAGYRAEIDDEGDIWYEDDDGDQYWDAAERLEDLERGGPFGGTCKICRDPVKYGLGHILDKCEDGLVEWQRERQKFVDRGVLNEKDAIFVDEENFEPRHHGVSEFDARHAGVVGRSKPPINS
ncbi:hypothetical protein CMUS01_07255 [Colletotrichum musicola]|uniref:Uncharacterized protein n=1 Tax=Colletotrichum musicola TaxID=2175873 RepID=A0A8H6KHF1_9PEZI|nr:hypothetical protein CMUS01_07255 [Colletotrichum musicola]